MVRKRNWLVIITILLLLIPTLIYGSWKFNPFTDDLDYYKKDSEIDHDALTNFATNEHFLEGAIDHVNILNIGTLTHAQIDGSISTLNTNLGVHLVDANDPHTATLTQTTLNVGTLNVTNTTGLIIPASSTYAFSRTGDADTGLYFNTTTSAYEFHRDGAINAYISGQTTPTYSFKGISPVALAIADNSYAFARAGDLDTGVYFNTSGAVIEFHLNAAVKHSFNIGANPNYICGKHVCVNANNQIMLEGAAGDTYIKYNSTSGHIEFYLNNVLEGYIDATGFVST